MTPTSVTAIEHIGIQVPDLDAALTFFCDRLGFELRFRGLGPDGETPVAFVACGDTEFEIFQRGDERHARLEHLGLRTGDDVVRASVDLAGEGVQSASGEVQGMRGTRAVLLEPESTLGIRMHLSTQGPGAASA
jgi:catechol 2,3-dioxygenase-like lactoylglutathione lyase family enzyme